MPSRWRCWWNTPPQTAGGQGLRCTWPAIWPPPPRPGGCLGCFTAMLPAAADALYGYFGLNLNALWNPAGVNGTVWSRLLPVQNQVGGNYDAFAYLGLGRIDRPAGGRAYIGIAAPAGAAWAGPPPLDAGRGLPDLNAVCRKQCGDGKRRHAAGTAAAGAAFAALFGVPLRRADVLAGLLPALLTAFVWLARAVPRRWRGAPVAAAVLLAAVQVWDIPPALCSAARPWRRRNSSRLPLRAGEQLLAGSRIPL